MPKGKIEPLNKSQALRLLKAQTRLNCAVELAERRKTDPDLSINQMLNDLINTGLSVTHHETDQQAPRPSELAMEAAIKSPEWKRSDAAQQADRAVDGKE